MFSHIPGNDHIKKNLTTALNKGVVGNSFLFAGPKNTGKSLFAKAFAKGIISNITSGTKTNSNTHTHHQKLETGNHPDLHLYFPEGKIGMHSIQTMRELSEEVYLPPYESERKVFIIFDAERMLPYSSNALLKTFEEPPSLDTVIILVSSAPDLILPTILSRCRKVFFSPLNEIEQHKIIQSSKSTQSTQNNDHLLIENILTVLSKGKFDSYSELTAKAKEFGEIIEVKTKEIETEMRALRTQSQTEKLSAVQRDSLEKEIEGAMSIETTREANKIFDAILSWHRDLLLLSVNGNHNHLINRNALESLKASLANNRMLPLDKVFTTIEDAKLALARSTSFSLTLETLFLKLHYF